MTWWKVSTAQKKSCEEREIWTKDGKTITRSTGFRWGTFSVETSDDNLPDGITEENEEGIDMYSHSGDNIEQIELDSMDDGCWCDYDYDGIDEDEQAEIEEGIEEDYYEYLEVNGWMNDETEAWLTGPLEITKIE